MYFHYFSERFYLVVWEEEGTVSVHSHSELKEPVPEEEHVGGACSVKFGKTIYTGKIASMGKLTWLAL